MNRTATTLLLVVTSSLAVHAQVFTAPFQLNGNTVTTQAGTFGDGTGLDEPNAGYSSITIGSGTTINSSVATGGVHAGDPGAYLIRTSTASFTNQGTVLFSPNDFDETAVLLDQGGQSVNINNSGTITTFGGGTNSQHAFFIITTTGNATLTNTGTLSSVNGNGGIPVWFQSTSGSFTVTNALGADITAQLGIGRGIEASTGDAGTFNITNNGTISTGQDGIDLFTSGSGAISVTNNGALSATNNGITANSGTGAINILNTGTITGSSVTGDTTAPIIMTNTGSITTLNSGGMGAVGTNVTMINSGTIVAYVGMDLEQSGNGFVKVTNSGTIHALFGIQSYQNAGQPTTITNTGLIDTTDEGIYLYSIGTVINSGTITSGTNAIDVPSGSTVVLQGHNQTTGTVLGGADPTSTSTLKFNLTIPAANLAAAKTQLNTEIAAYGAQNGGNFTFTVDGLSFDVSNFDYSSGVLDNLIASRLYANIPGYNSLGSAIDRANPNTRRGATLVNALGNVPDAGVAGALAELSPKSLQVFNNVANDNNGFFRSQLDNHLANLRDGLTGFDTSGFTINAPGLDPQITQMRSHLLAWNPAPDTHGLLSDSPSPLLSGVDMKEMRSRAEPTDRWSSFISGSVILDNNSSNIGDTDYTTGSVIAGVDYRLDDHFTVGALFNYAHSAADLDDHGSKATVDSYAPGLYASYVDGGWYANGMAAYVRNAYTDDREINIPGLVGDNHGATSGDQASANLTGGYEFQKGPFKFGPVASLGYVHLSIDSMQEDGPTSLQINSRDTDSLRSLLGVEGRFTTDVTAPWGRMSLTPHASASWQHEYFDASPGISAQFTGTGGGSFSVQTDNNGRDSAFLDIGLDAVVAKNVTLFVDYTAQAGQDNFFAQSAQGGVRVGF